MAFRTHSTSSHWFSLGPSSLEFSGEPSAPRPTAIPSLALSTCVHPVVRLQLVLEAEFLATAVALVGFLPGVDAFVALECALIPEATATELTLVRVVACGDKGPGQAFASRCRLLSCILFSPGSGANTTAACLPSPRKIPPIRPPSTFCSFPLTLTQLFPLLDFLLSLQ